MSTAHPIHILRPGTGGATAAPEPHRWCVATPRLPTGIPPLDLVLEGGLPLGAIVQITSQHGHAAKTTLALSVLGRAQAAGLGATYVPGATIPPAAYFAACGVDPGALHIPPPSDVADLEGALEAATDALAGGNCVVALDPLPAFPTRVELEGGVRDAAGHRW